MTEKKSLKPVPMTQPWTEEFWKAAKQHKFLIQHCHDCDINIFYPRKFCPDCWGTNLGWIEASGQGKLHTYTVTHYGVEQRFAGDLPFVLALVDMEEGIRVMTRIVNCKHENLKCDMPVELTWEDLDENFSLYYFQPAKA
jgi:hypothetical protein